MITQGPGTEVPGPCPSLGVIMDVGPVWGRLPQDVRVQAWRLVVAGWPLEANRVLTEALGDAAEAAAVLAFLVRRKLGIHN